MEVQKKELICGSVLRKIGEKEKRVRGSEPDGA
jgi:hypothetical protein